MDIFVNYYEYQWKVMIFHFCFSRSQEMLKVNNYHRVICRTVACNLFPRRRYFNFSNSRQVDGNSVQTRRMIHTFFYRKMTHFHFSQLKTDQSLITSGQVKMIMSWYHKLCVDSLTQFKKALKIVKARHDISEKVLMGNVIFGKSFSFG